MSTLELDVEPNVSLSTDLHFKWSELKFRQGATLRRGVGSVTRMNKPSLPVKFSEVWAYDLHGDAIYAAGNTDLEAIQNAVNGEWFTLGGRCRVD